MNIRTVSIFLASVILMMNFFIGYQPWLQSGLAWIDIPLMDGFVLMSAPAIESSTKLPTPKEALSVPVEFLFPPTESMRDNGFTLAIVVLLGMFLSLLYTLGRLLFGFIQEIHPRPQPAWLDWMIPLLCVIGLGVAGYLSYIEITLSKALCGSVGDCNTVQLSPYARLWGVLPIGVLGMGGYIAMIIAWWTGRQKWSWVSSYAPIALFGLAFFGTVFSAYLTYLEPFVIKAVCIWCITSAVIVTLLLLLSSHSVAYQLPNLDEDQ